MTRIRSSRGPLSVLLCCALLVGCARQLSSDPYTNPESDHRTQVEPDSFAVGSTIVSAFQVGRAQETLTGASAIGWATSTDAGETWSRGFLAGITEHEGGGPYERVSDPSVAYDAKHGVWMISSLALEGPAPGRAVLVTRSVDGGLTWSTTHQTVAAAARPDKNWTVCDNTPTSPFYGRCYTQWDDNGNGNALHMERSTDGGLTWVSASVPNGTSVIGGQPLVQPNGKVIVPITTGYGSVQSFVSTDGGVTYTGPNHVASICRHVVAGGLRAPPLPSAEIDAAGRVYVVWQDCGFRGGSTSPNDIVMSTSTNGTTWSPIARVPIDPVTSTVDHFTPGLGVDASTSGATARLALAYYFYPDANCDDTTCALSVGFVSSTNGGASWSAPSTLGGPMSLDWLAQSNQGPMVADYISTSFSGASAFPVFALAKAPDGGTYNEAIHTFEAGVTGGTATAPEVPLESPSRQDTPELFETAQ